MDLMPAALAAQMAITQKNATLGIIRKSAEADQAIATMIEKNAQSLALAASGRGGSVDLFA